MDSELLEQGLVLNNDIPIYIKYGVIPWQTLDDGNILIITQSTNIQQNGIDFLKFRFGKFITKHIENIDIGKIIKEKIIATDNIELSEYFTKYDHLPIYTILVPIYNEANLIIDLAIALSAIDYPEQYLDIKIIMEASDKLTINTVNATKFRSSIEIHEICNCKI